MTTEPKKPEPKKPEPESKPGPVMSGLSDKSGPIPMYFFENDLPYNSNTDTSPGSLYDRIGKRVEADKAKKK